MTPNTSGQRAPNQSYSTRLSTCIMPAPSIGPVSVPTPPRITIMSILTEVAEDVIEGVTLIFHNKDEIMVSALKKADNEDALILRMYNAASRPVENVAVTFFVPIMDAYLSNFNESNQKKLEVIDKRVLMLDKIGYHTVLTLKIFIDKDIELNQQQNN
ncbi:MAG TPA: hypothetical protein DDX29_01085 [Clostridiales bacterium]|nr:hypothetical protein [Clostridiales bacterium]